MEQLSLRGNLDPVYAAVKRCVDEWDPYGLLEIGAPEDEFDTESRMVAERISPGLTAEEIAEAVNSVFSDQFFPEDFGLENCRGVAIYIHKSRISGREYLAPTEEENRVIYGRIDANCVRFVGASALPVGWNEPKQITVGDTVTHKKTGQRAKVTSKHTQYFKAFGGVRWVYGLDFGKSVTFAGAEMNGGEFLFEAIEKV